MKKGVVRVMVSLRRFSPKIINFQPTHTHFYLDTLKYTKKYVLQFRYPHNIVVDVSAEPVSQLSNNGLTTELRIVDWGNIKERHDTIIAQLAQYKEKKAQKK